VKLFPLPNIEVQNKPLFVTEKEKIFSAPSLRGNMLSIFATAARVP